MGLEDGHEPPVLQRPCRIQGGGDLAGMVSVVVIQHTAFAVAERLKAPACSVKAGEPLDRPRRIGPRQAGRLQGARGVDRVVGARNGQAHVVPVPDEAEPQAVRTTSCAS